MTRHRASEPAAPPVAWASSALDARVATAQPLRGVVGLLLILALCVSAPLPAAAPDFSAVVAVEAEIAGAGKVVGLISNVGAWTIRNVVLRVRHRWTWGEARSYRFEEKAVVSDLVYPGDPAGFAAVHIPPVGIPEHARYAMDVTVLELTEIRIASD